MRRHRSTGRASSSLGGRGPRWRIRSSRNWYGPRPWPTRRGSTFAESSRLVGQAARGQSHDAGAMCSMSEVTVRPAGYRVAAQQVPEIEPEDVHGVHLRVLGPDRAQRFEVRLVGQRREQEEVAHASTSLPRVDKFVHHPCSVLWRRATPPGGACRGVHPVLQRRRPNDASAGRDFVGQVFHDDRVGAEGQALALQRGGARPGTNRKGRSARCRIASAGRRTGRQVRP
jgi:hypothetical protein